MWRPLARRLTSSRLSVPAQEVLDLAEEPSQLISDVPDAFRPESLATIETQCRNFLT